MIPDFQTIMLPLLTILKDGKEHNLRDVIKEISDQFNLTDEERVQLLPSANQAIINNRVGWARTYLKKANLLDTPKRGVLKITEDGIPILSKGLTKVDVKFLQTLPKFQEWQRSYAAKTDDGEAIGEESKIEAQTGKTPEELLDYSYNQLKEELASEIIDKVKSCSPAFFELLVIDLLIKMGYGGSRKEAGEVLGKSGDGGIDGIIKEDKLGLDTIYIQAKRWENTVTIHQVRDFAGSLLSKKAKKGIFITTSSYPASAKEFVGSIDPKIVLIDGNELANLMIEFKVGVSVKKTYEVQRLDSDYFDEV
ncbi:restriction endonuclease [Niastella koreensis]|uniref:Restriction endonuclease n=2 Tax=Niastella koreensis TaxID=354356 RepID=G8T7V5_NIAKG|nr:restriction endonuclease [Niastella koreensis]AEW03399.1 restriction endonuclease [Niastella koreensis GR20-10]OQP55681.1 restriction endonuclease [Niastella koreensis]